MAKVCRYPPAVQDRLTLFTNCREEMRLLKNSNQAGS
jgi:hypothetical protein